eukprot:gene5297-7069_t
MPHFSKRLHYLKDYMWGGFAYAVSPLGARRLLALAFPAEVQVDSFMMTVSKREKFRVFVSNHNLATTDNSPSRKSSIQRYVISEQNGLPLLFHKFLSAEIVLSFNTTRLSTCSPELVGTSSAYNIHLESQLHEFDNKKCYRLLEPVAGKIHQISVEINVPLPDVGMNLRIASEEILRIFRTVGSNVHEELATLLSCLDLLLRVGGVCISKNMDHTGNYEVWEGLLWHLDAFGAFTAAPGSIATHRVFGSKPNSLAVVSAARTWLDFASNTSIPYLSPEDSTRAIKQIMNAFQIKCTQMGSRCRIFHRNVVFPSPSARTSRPYFLNSPSGIDALTSEHKEYDVNVTSSVLTIPHLIHIIAIDQCRDVSLTEARSILSWIQHHPGWEVKIWTQSDLEKLNLRLQPLIDATTTAAQKSDLARIELLARFGGVYVDTDLEYLVHYLEQLSQRDWKENPKIIQQIFSEMIIPRFSEVRIIPYRWIYPIRYWERGILLEHKCFTQSCRFFNSYVIHLPTNGIVNEDEVHQKLGCGTTKPLLTSVKNAKKAVVRLFLIGNLENCISKDAELRNYITYLTLCLTNPSKRQMLGVQLTTDIREWLHSTAMILEQPATGCLEILARITAGQHLFNAMAKMMYKSYSPGQIPVASYVYRRADVYRKTLEQFRKQRGIAQVHLIVSMDWFDSEYLRMLDETITFCTWQPIVHVHETREILGLQEEGKLHGAVPLAFHWWWLQEKLWTELLAGYDGDVLFVEEDHLLLSGDALTLALELMRMKNMGTSQCDTISLSMTTVHTQGQLNQFAPAFGDAVGAVVEQPLFSNMVYAFNRSIYGHVLPHKHIEWDWDWNLHVAFYGGEGFSRKHLQPVRKRVVNAALCANSVEGIHQSHLPVESRLEYCGTSESRGYDLQRLEQRIQLTLALSLHSFRGHFSENDWVHNIVAEQLLKAECPTDTQWVSSLRACEFIEGESRFCCAQRYRMESEEPLVCVPEPHEWYPLLSVHQTDW